MNDLRDESPRDAARLQPAILWIGIALLFLPVAFRLLLGAETYAAIAPSMALLTAVGVALVSNFFFGKLILKRLVLASGGMAILLILVFSDPVGMLNPPIPPSAGPSSEHSSPVNCKQVESLAMLGWTEGHKTNYCASRKFEGMTNFPGGHYRSNGGGFCYSGDESACLKHALDRMNI